MDSKREISGEWVDIVISPRPNLNDDTDKLQSICRGACGTCDFAIDPDPILIKSFLILYDIFVSFTTHFKPPLLCN
jgi:hypothetical protein